MQGSVRMARLAEQLRPRRWVFAHHHVARAGIEFDGIPCTGLSSLVPPARRDPEQRLAAGGLALLDTNDLAITVPRCEWLCEFDNRLDYADLLIRSVRR